MNENIVSEITLGYYVTVPILYLIGIISWCAIFCGAIIYGHQPGLVIFAVLFFAGLQAFYIYKGIITKIIVNSNCIEVYYLFKNPKRIDYRDITYNRNLRGSSGQQGQVITYRTQEIGLTDGSEIVFSDLKFKNYDELKDHIFKYMVAANEAR